MSSSWTPSWVTEGAKKKRYRSLKSHIPCTFKMPGPCPEKPKEDEEDDWRPPTPPPVLMRIPAPLPPTYKVVQGEESEIPCGGMKFSSCIVEVKNKQKCVEDEGGERDEEEEQGGENTGDCPIRTDEGEECDGGLEDGGAGEAEQEEGDYQEGISGDVQSEDADAPSAYE